MGRFKSVAEIEIEAPIERAYGVATDPNCVLKYEPDLLRLEPLEGGGPSPRGENQSRRKLMRVTMRLGPLWMTRTYRYVYAPPRSYGGVESGRGIVRGYFAFRFIPTSSGTTRVRHVEGIRSRWPLLAGLTGWLYFRCLKRGGVEAELRSLRDLILSARRLSSDERPPTIEA